jgi:hypothetical protein
MSIRLWTCFALVAASGLTATAAEVRLRSTVICSASIVRLSDVAEIVAEQPQAADELAAIVLFPAPQAGRIRQLDRHQVRQLMAFSGVDLAKVAITGSDTVVVQADETGTAGRPVKRGGRQNSTIRLASAEVAEPDPRASTPASPAPLKLVERGDSVTIHSRASGIRISTSGKALSDGALGDEIAVELADRKVQLVGRIAGPQLIEVTVQP